MRCAGKFVNLNFDLKHFSIIAATTDTYLLEKSRVSVQTKGPCV